MERAMAAMATPSPMLLSTTTRHRHRASLSLSPSPSLSHHQWTKGSANLFPLSPPLSLLPMPMTLSLSLSQTLSPGSASAAAIDDMSSAATEALQSGTVSFLFVAAALGLVVLTGGVIYLSVSEYLEKQQQDKELKEAAAKAASQKKKSKKVTIGRSGGPRGFGKKFVEGDE